MTTQYIELSPDGQAGQKPKVGNHIIDWVRSPNFISRYAVCVILSVQKGTSLVKRSIRASGKTERRTGKVGSLVFCLLKGQRHLKTKHIQQVMEYAVTCFFMDSFMDKRDGEYEEAVKWTWKHKSVRLFMRH